MLTNATLVGRLFDDPVALLPDRAEAAAHMLLEMSAAIDSSGRHLFASTDLDDGFWGDEDIWRPYVVKDGILQVPIRGVLLNKLPYQIWGWATGYEYVEQAVRRGLADSAVRGIALMVDSPGGLVAGCFECADFLHEAGKVKPIRAYVDTAAYSAAYALASAAEQIVVTRSGGTGSVGVIMAHVDYSELYSKVGLKVTLIYSGKHKADGNPYEALPEDVRARFQAKADKIRAVFVSTVARNRNMSEDAVHQTEAMTYDAEESVEVGFADAISSVETAMAQFAQELETEYRLMPTENQNAASFTEADVAAARAEGFTNGREEGLAAGRAEGVTTERERVSAILGSEEAKNRPVSALAAALDTDMPADKALAFLSKLPEEKAASLPADKEAPKGFNSAMDNTQNPNVGADAQDDGDEEDRSVSLISAGRRAIGLKPVN